MAMWRGIAPFVEPIDSDSGKIKYWPLPEILPGGFISLGTPPSSQCQIWRSRFKLQNSVWYLTAHITEFEDGRTSLMIRIYHEYSTSCIEHHPLADVFTILIGIVGKSGEAVKEKAKPSGRFGFEVYRLIDDVDLETILKSKIPFFFFVEIEKKDIIEEKQNVREKKKELKKYPCERFENAFRIYNRALAESASNSASPPAITTPEMFPPMTLSSVVKETPDVTSPPLNSSLNSSLPTSSNASPPATTATVMFPSKSMSSALKETPYVTSAPLNTSLNSSLPTSSNASLPATTTTVMFPSKLMSSAIKQTSYVTSPPLDPSLNSSLPASSSASSPAVTNSVMFPSKSKSWLIKKIPNVTSPPMSPSLNSSLPTSSNASPPATTTTVLFPSKPMSSAIKETPYATSTLSDTSLNSSLPTSSNASRPATITAVLFPSKSMSSALKETPYVTSTLSDTSLNSSLPTSSNASPPATTTTVMITSKPMSSAIKETPYVTSTLSDTSLNSSLPTSSNTSRPATITAVLFPSKPMSSAIKETPYVTSTLSDTSLNSSLPTSSNASPPATTTTVMITSKPMSSAIKETPYVTSPPLVTSLNSSLPTSSNASRPATITAVLFPSKSMSSALKETPNVTSPPLDPSINSSLPASSNASPPATTTTVMFPSKSMSSALKETPTYLTPPPLDPSLSNSTPSLLSRPPNPSLPTSSVSHSFPNRLDEKEKILMNDSSNASPSAMATYGLFPSTSMPYCTKENSKYIPPQHLYSGIWKSTQYLPAGPPNPSLPPNRYQIFGPYASNRAAEDIRNMVQTYFPSITTPRLFPSRPTPETSPPLHSRLSNWSPSVPHRPPNPSLPTNRYQIFGPYAAYPAKEDITNMVQTYLPATTTPSRSTSSAIKETSPPLHPSISNSTPSLPARPPTFFFPTSGQKKFQMDYRDLLLSGKGSDFTIIVKDTKFHAHKLILGIRSSVFSEMTEPELSINDVDPAIFREFLLYIYTGYEEDIDWKNIAELYKLADNYCVEDLKELCVKHMVINISMENFFEIFMLSLQSNKAILSEVTMEFFLRNSKEIIESERYIGFMNDYPDKAYVLVKALANK